MEQDRQASCLNCGHPLTGPYCANCGQSARIERFNLRYFGQKLIHAIDLDRGFFHTIWLLVTRPGSALREYILGKRVGFSNPIKLFVIIGAIVTILFNQSIKFNSESIIYIPGMSDWEGFVAYSGRYFSFFTLSAIPIFSLASWLIFFKSGFNYLENFVMNFYVAVGQFMIMFPILPFFFTPYSDFFNGLYGIINIIYNIWALIYFFRSFSTTGVFKSILAVLIPFPVAVYANYWLYRLAPQTFWEYLDNVMF